MKEQESPTRQVRTRMRGASLLIVATALYLAAICGSLYTLETAYYLPSKWDVISQQLKEAKYIDFEVATRATNVLKQYARLHYEGIDGDQEELRDACLERMNELLDASPEITGAFLEDVSGETVLSVTRPERVFTQHDLSNRLLTGHFERSSHQTLLNPNLEPIGRFRLNITTAKGNTKIEALTTRYRWLMIASVLAFTLIYYLLLRLVILPLTRVLNFMQIKGTHSTPLIPVPTSQLERAYNNLARDAALTRFSKQLREFISSKGLSHIEPIFERVPKMVSTNFPVEDCEIWVLLRDVGEKTWHTEKIFSEERAEEPAEKSPFAEQLHRRLQSAHPFENRDFWTARLVTHDGNKALVRPFFCDILNCTEDRVSLLVIRDVVGAATAWWIDFYGKIAQELRYAISSIEEQRRMILQEKSKANISLSRNLGHDLTNIIATSKLELMTVRAFLSLKAEDVKNSPQKEGLFKESLEALLNNTRFLQEIVNLYRSFSYLQKPKFEETQINDLVKDVTELYRLSTSNSMKIEEMEGDDVPVTRVEPRLLRLALFNLLTNAADAIKRATSAENPSGTISVNTCFVPKYDRVEITVADTGTGICDEEGNLLSPDSLSEIFRLGFSTKANQEGEGLGLNWVQTIVREFHGGEVVAANRPDGGAAFTIRLPVTAPVEESNATPSKSEIPKLQSV